MVVEKWVKFVFKESLEPLVEGLLDLVWGSVVLLTELLAEFDICISCLGHATKQ